ncbi:hypothetical protein C5F49_03240 [Nitrosopumilus oxyclinae]|uniref:Uncharacterized protein n=1 Tax=Nitrosopumilus oxyclinae TaxID=1959104 RepID=A0A7D5R4J0_9ARCH|nr:hypothetical protein [Nitrosopumilus oxyclinae]QLH04439.1 hypothetical protein C5F49_03240 [Nitrosopumilus oxyclinae]
MIKIIPVSFLIFVLLASTVTTSNIVFADVLSPKGQMDLNFTAKEVICNEKFVKIIRTLNGNAVCVSPVMADLLVKRGFALPPDPIDVSKVEELKSKPIGTLTHMATTKQYKNPGAVETFPKIDTLNYVFKICAIDEKIRSPEVIITSDSETKSVKLRDVELTSCYTTAAKIRASDPESISARLLNHGGITESITELENKITSLKLDLSSQREKLSTIDVDTSATAKAKIVSAIHKKISEIRTDLNNTRAELQKYLLFLSLSATTDNITIQKGKSITGMNVDGVVSEIISVNLALIQPEDRPENSMAYNVVFEICTGDNPLRIPVVELSSDIGTKVVKMAEKIVKNSCQVSTGKINALSPSSIIIKLAGQTQSSETIVQLEKKIESIKDEMMVVQKALNSASTSSSISKEERQKLISEGTDKTIELRKELNSLKVELHKILLEIYR